MLLALKIELNNPGGSEALTIALTTNLAFLECSREIIAYLDNIAISPSPTVIPMDEPMPTPSPSTAVPTGILIGFQEDWNDPSTLPLWVVTMSRKDSWDFEPEPFITKYKGKFTLELDAMSACEGDGYEASITWTLAPGNLLPVGWYDLQASLDHIMSAFLVGSCHEDWSIICIHINNVVMACHSMPCDLNGMTLELTLTASGFTDTLTLSISNGGCMASTSLWCDIILTPSTMNK